MKKCPIVLFLISSAQDAEELENRVKDLKVPNAKVYDDVKDAEKKLKNYEDQADKNSRVVKNATKMANESKTTAKAVMEDIEDVNRLIIELESNIADIPDLDDERLTELEKKIKEQESKDKEWETSLKKFGERKVELEQQIRSYYVDLRELEEALIELTENHEKLPKTCIKQEIVPNWSMLVFSGPLIRLCQELRPLTVNSLSIYVL